MKKLIFSTVVILLLIPSLSSVSAHPGRTDANGGHTCRINCEKWGLQPGEYHYHDANGNIIRQSEKKAQPVQKPTQQKSTQKQQNKKAQDVTVKVTKVIDGDTIVVKLNGKEEKVRLIGVDTPETVHPSKPVQYYGPEASAYTKKRLEGKTVILEFDVQQRDKYGRLLAYVWLGNEKNKKAEMFNQTLVKEGYAQVATFPPNVKYTDSFVKLQKEARESGKGLWGKK